MPKLRAEYHEGFSENLVGWTLSAQHGAAIINANWFSDGQGHEQEFTMPYEDSTIRAAMPVLSTLRDEYDGHVDDLPMYSLRADVDGTEHSVIVREAIEWPPDMQQEIDRFLSLWRPLYRRVDDLLPIRRRRG